MATKKISELPQATQPITETSPVIVVQGGVTKQAEAGEIAAIALINQNATITFTAPFGVEGQALLVTDLTENTILGPVNSASHNYFTNNTPTESILVTLSDSHTLGTQLTITRTGAHPITVVPQTDTLNVTYGSIYSPAVSNVFLGDAGDTLTVTKVVSTEWHGTTSGSGILFNE